MITVEVDSDYIPVHNDATFPRGTANNGGGGDASLSLCQQEGEEDESSSSAPPTMSLTNVVLTLLLGLLSASPTLLLLIFGANTPTWSIFVYIALILVTSTCAVHTASKIESGIARWFIGLILIGITSTFKSGHLLTFYYNNVLMKGVLYAITALWECSNAVLAIGGKDLLERYNISLCSRDIILLALAPCQVKFFRQEISAGYEYPRSGGVNNWSLGGKLGRRSIHITLCTLGVAVMYLLLARIQPIKAVVTSFILFDIEYSALMASMAVVVLDIPAHLYQIIHDGLASTPIFSTASFSSTTSPQVILPYGWIYSSTSTREFWSRWSRPAMQLIRRLFYYPLGGRNRWYISIPITFLLNANTHFDLSYTLVGDRAEVYWMILFGTLAVVAMLEVAGDKVFANVILDGEGNNNGNVSFPRWYKIVRAVLAHASLRFVLYIMIYKIFHYRSGILSCI